MIGHTYKQRILFIGAIGISIFLLFLIITSSRVCYEIKTQCQRAQQQCGGDCIEALSTLLDDNGQNYYAHNPAIWRLDQSGDARTLPKSESDYTGGTSERVPMNENLSQYELSKALNLMGSSVNIFSWTWHWNIDIGETEVEEAKIETIILCEEDDPYYSLAEKISGEENIPVVHSLAEIQEYNPEYILVVAAPQNLSEEKVVNIGRLFKNTGSYTPLGIITGSTIDIAENLYRRGSQITPGNNYIGADVEAKSFIDRPLIIKEDSESRQEIDLTQQSLIDTLQTSDYFYWGRHVSIKRWIWNTEESHDVNDNDCLTAEEVPPLKPVVIHTPSCSSFHPWADESIALAFIDQGAAAYIGHLQTPTSYSGIFIGHTRYLPGKYTWNDFPIGMVMQVQNHNTTKVGSETPLFFMMGDPRMHLEDPPLTRSYPIKPTRIKESSKPQPIKKASYRSRSMAAHRILSSTSTEHQKSANRILSIMHISRRSTFIVINISFSSTREENSTSNWQNNRLHYGH